MRPLRLKMSAFGPYSGNIEINMSDLGENGLYLITGDTGAGKTTIFDAICFALFGNASGANREASMLRSKYADIATPTEVELLFSHADKEYIVKRNPEYMRPAKRGEGLKKETANAQLTYPDGRIVTRVKDVDMAIVELLGIDRNQFSQIAMLSQGEFLKLLLADTKSRQQIFRELFKTSYYQTLQYRLEDSRKEIYVKFSQTQESIKQYISSIMADEEDVLSIEAQKAKSGQMTTQDIIELIDKLIDSDNSKSDKKLEEQRIVEKELEKVNTDLGKAEELEKLKTALTKAKEALISFKSKESEFKDKVAKAKEGLVRKEELFQQAAVIDAELARYKELDNITAIICDNLVRLKKYNANLQTGIDEQNKKLAEYENIKQELESLKEAGTKREKLLRDKEGLEVRIKDLKLVYDDLNMFESKQKEYVKLQNQYISDEAKYQKLKDEFDDMDKAYRDGQAGILASQLCENEPCPVCGSCVHPKLAVLTDDIPTRQELEKAKEIAEKGRTKAFESSRKAGEVKSSSETLKQSVIKKVTDMSYEEEKALYELLLQDFEANYIHVINEVQKLSQNIRKQILELQKALQEEEQKVFRKNQISELIPQLEDRLKYIENGIADLKSKISNYEGKQEADQKQQQDIKAGLSFENSDAAKKHKQKLENECLKIQQAYDAADREYKEYLGNISKLEGQIEGYNKSIEASPAYDIEKEKSKKQDILLRKSSVEKQCQEIQMRIMTNEGARLNIVKKLDEMTALEKKLQWMTALSNTANGKISGKEKIMLETYIQTTYFDRIIERANIRLMKMSGAQYELKRQSEAENNRSQSGLELGVIDHYNGTFRSVKTLSGGESFMASLSLALGLSDEVQSCAGGIRIDSLFVDEGFGSLDSDSLEQAYQALAGLTEGNRLVGIISHVSDLKEKIDRQIVVTKDRVGGSKVRIQI